ncbi:MAG: hypothetical protein D6701_01450 [Gemmatimonadetes bacterium]|nr:MAG: hypothetical protein D6701_01450 [Gemmatimonadota bacterium]
MNALLQASATAADTVYALVPRDPLGAAADVALVVTAAGVVLLLALLAVVLLQVRRLLAALNERAQPTLERTRGAAENLEYITGILKRDVDAVQKSVQGLGERLRETSEAMEARVRDFNALMDVLQDEAESIALDTAAAVRGVRTSARSLAAGEGSRHADSAPAPAAEVGSEEGPAAEPSAAAETPALTDPNAPPPA